MEIVRPEFETNKELKLNVIAAENVRQAMWWARFMAIVGFFVTGLLAVFALGCMIGGASWGYAMNSLFLQGKPSRVVQRMDEDDLIACASSRIMYCHRSDDRYFSSCTA